MNRLSLVVPGLSAVAQEYNEIMRYASRMAIANTPHGLADKMATEISTTFFTNGGNDFDLVMSFGTDQVSPNRAVSFTDLYLAIIDRFTDEVELLNTANIGHICGSYSNDGAVLTGGDTVPHTQCPGCILDQAVVAGTTVVLQGVHLFHSSISSLYGWDVKPNTRFISENRVGDLLTVSEVYDPIFATQ